MRSRSAEAFGRGFALGFVTAVIVCTLAYAFFASAMPDNL